MPKEIPLDNVKEPAPKPMADYGWGKPRLRPNQVDLDLAAGSFAVIQSTRNNASAAGTVSYAHGLGKVPTRVGAHSACYTGGALSFCNGFYDGTNQCATYGSIGAAAVGNSGFIYIDQGGGVVSYGLVTSVDETNVNIAWDKLGAPAGTTYFTLEVYG